MQQSQQTFRQSPSAASLDPSVHTKRYLAGLKAQKCSCARQQAQVKVQQHLPSCELIPVRTKQMREQLGFVYRRLCEVNDCLPLNSFQMLLNKEQKIKADIDQFSQDVEKGIYRFLQQKDGVKQIQLWSSLVKLEDVQSLLNSNKGEEANLMHASILSFNEWINKFKRECSQPTPIATSRSQGFPFSIDAWCNKHLIHSVCTHLTITTTLTELTICGVNMNDAAFKALNKALMQTKTVRKLALNFCISKREQLHELMPALTDPESFPVQELSLAANGLTDSDFGDHLAKILSMHTEARDEIIWKYGLRGEAPPPDALIGLKKFDLSFNKLSSKTAFAFAKALKSDRYLLQLNFKSNLLSDADAKLILSYLSDNETLFNLDMRLNTGITAKTYRKLAMKLLASYTAQGQKADPQQWITDMKHFDTKLLEVEIPTAMVNNYAKKLEQIRQGSLSQAMANKTNKFHRAPQTARANRRKQKLPSPVSTAASSAHLSQKQKLMLNLKQARCFSGPSLDSIREETLAAERESRETLGLANINTAQSTYRASKDQLLAMSHRPKTQDRENVLKISDNQVWGSGYSTVQTGTHSAKVSAESLAK